MVRYSFFYLIFILNFTILSCDKSVSTGGLKPASVVFVSKTADASILERGIDAVPDGDKIKIEWFLNPEKEVEKYNIYRSEEDSEKFSFIFTTRDTVYEDMVKTHTKYYYYVNAETDEGVTSEPSDTINYTLLDKALLLSPGDTVSTAKPEFVWLDTNEHIYDQYIIRVVNIDYNKTIWIAVKERENYDTGQEKVVFNADSSAAVSQLSSDISYKWRIDIVGNERKGSESNWKSLVYRREE
ncbi:MAG: hypothetical protein R6V04_15085 [bacterium]